MKPSIFKKSKIAALLAAGLMFGAAQSALAAPTQAGTSISNTATLTYTVSGVDPTAGTGVSSTSPAFLVDNKVNLSVTGGTQTSVVPNQTAVVTPFTLTNLGNATQGYSLTATNMANGSYTVGSSINDDFDPTAALSIYLDSNGDGVLSAAEQAAGAITSIATLNAGSSIHLLVVTNIPAGQINNDAAVVSLKAQTVWPTPLVAAEEPSGVSAGATVAATVGADTANAVDVVLADALNSTTGDAARDGADSGYGAYKVVTAALTINKTSSLLCDPYNGTANQKNIPGAMTQWTITISNAAGAGSAAVLSQVTDTLATQLAMDPGTAASGPSNPSSAATCVAGSGHQGFKVTASASRNLGGSAGGAAASTSYFTDTVDGDGLDNNAGAITATFSTILPSDGSHATAGQLNAGESVTIVFNTTVQ